MNRDEFQAILVQQLRREGAEQVLELAARAMVDLLLEASHGHMIEYWGDGAHATIRLARDTANWGEVA
jgi:hypothetical protein